MCVTLCYFLGVTFIDIVHAGAIAELNLYAHQLSRQVSPHLRARARLYGVAVAPPVALGPRSSALRYRGMAAGPAAGMATGTSGLAGMVAAGLALERTV